MFDTTPVTAVIGVDTDAETISFYVDLGDRREVQQVVSYRCAPFSEEFYQKLDKAIKSYQQRNPSVSLAKIAVVLSDQNFLMDTINVPTLNRKAMENSLEVAISAIYKNKKDLRYRTCPLSQNKQFATFGLVGVRKAILDKLEDVCAANQISIQSITFAANAMTCGAMVLNPKLKNSTFLLLDIKETCARFAFVNKGRVIGAYRLPFGDSMLYKSRLVSEDLLFDHATGELLVLNAAEKARAKQLTMIGEDALDEQNAMPQETEDEEEELVTGGAPGNGKKMGRKLPKFMQREMPTDREGFVYENFRIFLKWTLDLLTNNPTIIAQGAIDTVYVNMAKEYDFLFSRLSAEEAENGVKFAPLLAGNGYSEFAGDARELELFGAFQLKQFSKLNNF
jgi:hypothetical protein